MCSAARIPFEVLTVTGCGDGHTGHPLTLPALGVHLTALFLFVTMVASKKIMDLVHKALYELVVLLVLERLGPY